MEQDITTKEFEVRFSDCDHHSRLKLSNLFLFMEETAIADAEKNGFGLWKMMQAGYTTVITRLKIRILHTPVWGEKIAVSTWAKDIIKDKVVLKDYSIVDSQAAAGFGSVSRTSGRLNADVKAKYILFPVYMFDISHHGTNYHFAVNGQTGKVVGDIPTDSGVSFLYFLKRFAIVGGGLFAASVVKYMLGF